MPVLDRPDPTPGRPGQAAPPTAHPTAPPAPPAHLGGRHSPARGVYGISVAAELAGSGIQALRLYERRGLLAPDRTEAGTRRYSDNDLARVRRITDLLGDGLNLAGVAAVLHLEAENDALRAEIAAVRAQLRAAGGG